VRGEEAQGGATSSKVGQFRALPCRGGAAGNISIGRGIGAVLVCSAERDECAMSAQSMYYLVDWLGDLDASGRVLVACEVCATQHSGSEH
jgi:hypothetical protein